MKKELKKGYIIGILSKAYGEQEGKISSLYRKYTDGYKQKILIVSTTNAFYVYPNENDILFLDSRSEARVEKAKANDVTGEFIWSVEYNPITNKIVNWIKKNP